MIPRYSTPVAGALQKTGPLPGEHTRNATLLSSGLPSCNGCHGAGPVTDPSMAYPSLIGCRVSLDPNPMCIRALYVYSGPYHAQASQPGLEPELYRHSYAFSSCMSWRRDRLGRSRVSQAGLGGLWPYHTGGTRKDHPAAWACASASVTPRGTAVAAVCRATAAHVRGGGLC